MQKVQYILPEGLVCGGFVLRNTFIDEAHEVDYSPRSRSCPPRLCDVNHELDDLLVDIRAVDKTAEASTREIHNLIRFGKRMLSQMDRWFSRHTFFILKKPRQISGCLGCFFHRPIATLAPVYGSSIRNHTDPLFQCSVVCRRLRCLHNGLIIIFYPCGGIFHVRDCGIFQVTLFWLKELFENIDERKKIPLLWKNGKSQLSLCTFREADVALLFGDCHTKEYYRLTYRESKYNGRIHCL